MASSPAIRRFLAFCVSALFAVAAVLVWAQGTARADDGASPQMQTQSIEVTWKGFTGVFTWDFPYSDEFFYQDPATYSHRLCQSCFGLTVSSFRNAFLPLEEQGKAAVEYLTAAGFTDISTHGYNQKPGTDTVSYVIAHKRMDGFDLVAVGICGSGYQNEWASNMTLGEGTRHLGFSRSAMLIETDLWTYLSQHGIQDAKLWTSGFSRAGAISNILAADCIDSGRFDAVYGYSFAAPRTTTDSGDPGRYTLFNIVGKLDIVPCIPFDEYGYHRYGTDMYRIAMETDSAYTERFAQANAICLALTGDELFTSVESNAVLRTLIGYLLGAVPSASDFAEVLQPALRSVWADGDDSRAVLDNLLTAVQAIQGSGPEQERAIEELEDFLVNVIMANMRNDADALETATIRGDSVQITAASDPYFVNADTLFHEHWPELYMSWLFSSDDPSDVLTDNREYSYAAFSGTDFYVDVLEGGRLVERVYSDGRVTADAADVGDFAVLAQTTLRIPASVTGNQVILTIPHDRTYEVRIGSDTAQGIGVLSLLCTAGHAQMQIERDEKLHVDRARPASVRFVATGAAAQAGGDAAAGIGQAANALLADHSVARSSLPVSVLSSFLQNGNNHLTFNQVKTLVIVLAVLVFVAAVSFIVLAVRRRLRGTMRSVQATIAVHAVSACFFLWMSLNASILFPRISIAGVFFDMMASVSLALLMLKAVSHSNRRLVLCLMAAIVVDAVATFYTMSDMTAANYIYTAGYLLLTAGFVLTRRPGKVQMLIFAVLGVSASAAVVNIQEFQLGSIESQVVSLLAIIAAFAASTSLPGTLRIAAGMLMVPDVLDYIAMLFPDTPVLGAVSMAVYYAALFFLAASAFVLSREDAKGALAAEAE